MNFPTDLKYSKDHEWVKITGSEALVGITEFAQSELGDIVFVDINTVGQSVKQFALFGSVEAVKTVSDLFLPISGKILEVNTELNAKPELVNNAPYEGGWIVKIAVENTADLEKLMSAAEYQKLVGE